MNPTPENPESDPAHLPAVLPADSEAEDAGPQFNPSGRRVPAANGLAWIGCGWRHFSQSPLNWVAMTLIFGVLWLIISIVPLVNIISGVVFPIFSGGMMLACEQQRRTGTLAIGDLFAGFRQKTWPLALLGLISIGVMLASLIPFIATMGFGVVASIATSSGGVDALGGVSIGLMMLSLLFVVLVSCAMWMAMWFAPALVILQGLEPVAALKSSFIGCWRNPLAGLLYGLVLFIVLIIGAIPAFLGLLVVIPVMTASAYAGYRDIYLED